MATILYIHGMGGGADSRIPAFLGDWFRSHGRKDLRVVVRTYDFNPDRAAAQIDAWYAELRPALVIGESMGAVHALALLTRQSTRTGDAACEHAAGEAGPQGSGKFNPFGGMLPCNPASPAAPFPLLLVSPALNGPVYFYTLRFLTLLPGLRPLLNRIYKPREGERQAIDFTFANMCAWPPHRAAALNAAGSIHAFFGRRDHYRRSGVVSVRQWRRLFGPASYTLYDGTHYMEEEHLAALLIPAILQRV